VSTISKFNAINKSWGFSSFMPLVELHDPEKGFLVKDACIVGAEVFVCKSTNENQAAKLAVSIHLEVKQAIPKLKSRGQNQMF